MELGERPSYRNTFSVLLVLMFVIGTVARVAPLLDQDGRLFQQFPSEDGYLMLTIARNLALGHGMSTANGSIPTNGTQPLFNLIEAGCFYLVGGDKRLGVLLTLLCQIAAAVAGVVVLIKLGRHALRTRPFLQRWAPPLAAGLWYASSITVPHAMNCLETGLYGTLTIVTVYYWHRLFCDRSAQGPMIARALGVGVLLGLTFWARIDAAFLIGAVTVTHLFAGVRFDGPETTRSRLTESVLMGITSVVIASPWLLNNLLRFGSIMPISGTAQSHATALGSNLYMIPPKLFEYLAVFIPVPLAFEQITAIWMACVLGAFAYLALVLYLMKLMTRDERALTTAVLLLTTALVGYYGLVFGASHFVNRYLFPFSPFAALLMAVLVLQQYQRLAGRPWRNGAAYALGALTVVILVGTHVRQYMLGDQHMHFQVVEWAEQHVPEDAWVGAIQTGTLGFFHDRTVNLDGKVNPDVLAAKLVGKVDEYVAEARFGQEQGRIEYLIDWYGISTWRHGAFQTHFDLLVADPAQNLAVQKRREVPLAEAAH